MLTLSHSRGRLALLLGAAAVALSCSGGSGPAVPRTGTAAYYRYVADETWGKSDFEKTNENLAKITRGSSDLVAKAWAFRLILASGQIRGYSELADQYEIGARANKDNPMRLFRRVSDFRGLAGRMSLEFLSQYDEFSKAVPDREILIDFAYPPKGSLTLPPQTAKIQTGQLPSDTDAETVRIQMVQRGVVQQVAQAVGAAGDLAKAQSLLASRPVKVSRADFELFLAQALYDSATIFSPRKGADSVKQEHLCKRALKALTAAGDRKETKELKAKIEKDLKEIRPRA